MFEMVFPTYVQAELHKVLGVISKQTYRNISCGYTDEPNNETYTLLDGSVVSFPYRIYFIDDDKIYETLESLVERLIYDCIYTRCCDGYVREKHLKAILEVDYPEWCMPYILKLSSEYVVDIVTDIYDHMKSSNNALFQAFCELNPYIFRYSYSRMTSYWNEYYRTECIHFHEYVGYKLYKECFEYSRRFDKIGI